MTFVLNNAEEGFDHRVSLFNVPPVETAIQDIYVKDYRPIGQISKGSTLEFDVHNNSSDYIVLKDISLLLDVIIHDDKNKPVTAKNIVSLVNLPISSLFRQFDFSIQQQNITSTVGSNNAYKSIFDVLLKKGEKEWKTVMSVAGFFPDSAESMDDFILGDGNTGLSNRHLMTKSGKTLRLKSNMFVDICQQDRLLINGLPINLKFYPAPDNFALMFKTPDPKDTGYATMSKSYSVIIQDATLLVPYARMHPGVLTAHGEMLKKEMALYPFTRSEIKAYNIPKDSYTWTMDNLFQDSIPKCLVVGFVLSSAYSADNQHNPYNFQNFDLYYLDFQINGQSCGGRPMQPNFANKNYASTYCRLFDCVPPEQKELPNISYFDFLHGYAIYVFDLEKSKNSLYSNPLRRGQTRLTAKFAKSLANATTVIVYGSFEALMKIDQARNVVVET